MGFGKRNLDCLAWSGEEGEGCWVFSVFDWIWIWFIFFYGKIGG